MHFCLLLVQSSLLQKWYTCWFCSCLKWVKLLQDKQNYILSEVVCIYLTICCFDFIKDKFPKECYLRKYELKAKYFCNDFEMSDASMKHDYYYCLVDNGKGFVEIEGKLIGIHGDQGFNFLLYKMEECCCHYDRA